MTEIETAFTLAIYGIPILILGVVIAVSSRVFYEEDRGAVLVVLGIAIMIAGFVMIVGYGATYNELRLEELKTQYAEQTERIEKFNMQIVIYKKLYASLDCEGKRQFLLYNEKITDRFIDDFHLRCM